MGLFRNLVKEREHIKRELDLYMAESLLVVDRAIEDYRAKKNREIEDMAKRCAEQLGQYEHEFHSTKEVKGIELAKLEAKIEALKTVSENDVVTYKKWTEDKEKEILMLNTHILELIKKSNQVVFIPPVSGKE